MQTGARDGEGQQGSRASPVISPGEEERGLILRVVRHLGRPGVIRLDVEGVQQEEHNVADAEPAAGAITFSVTESPPKDGMTVKVKTRADQMLTPVSPKLGGGNNSSTSRTEYGMQPSMRNGRRRPCLERQESVT